MRSPRSDASPPPRAIRTLFVLAAALLLAAPHAARAGKQVEICHRPPGKPGAQHVLHVGEPAVEAHLLHHDDVLGPCAGKGGKGKGAALAAVTYHCLGFQDHRVDGGSPFSYVADTLVLDAGRGDVVLDAAAAGDLPEAGVLSYPVQGAATSLDTGPLALRPFDLCASTAESLLDAVVQGTHLGDPAASGVADVEFHVHYRATLELASRSAPDDFVAFTETTLEVPGFPADTFRVASDGGGIEAPPGTVVEDLSSGGRRVYEVSGTYVVPGRLPYGPGTRSVVTTTLFVGAETAEVVARGGRIVAGFAAVDAMDSLDYEILSLDPDVAFRFVPEAPAEAP